jgi:hypothetical protein
MKRSPASFRKLIDKKFSLLVRERDGWTCVLCGESYRPVLSAGHLFSRGADSTRFDPLNVFCQCGACNGYHEINPHIFTLWFIRQFSLEAYEALNVKHRTLAHYKAPDLVEILGAIEERKSPYSIVAVWYKPDPFITRLVRAGERLKREEAALEIRKHGLESRLSHIKNSASVV